jgi:F-type H+-transporting ATPase subunit b
MRIDWWTLGLQAVNVLVLIWLLSRFLFRPVMAMIEARRAAIAKELDDARAAQAEAEAQKEHAKQEAADLAAARNSTLEKAAADGETEKTAILAAAREAADRLRATAEAGIVHSRQAEAAAAGDRASHLAIDIAEKLLARLPDEARISGFVAGLVEGVSALPEAIRQEIVSSGAPIRLHAPRALTASETEACRDQLEQALGRPVEIAVAVDPRLIAGLEIDMPHAVVRNSFRADLDRIAATLTQPAQDAS